VGIEASFCKARIYSSLFYRVWVGSQGHKADPPRVKSSKNVTESRG